MLGAGGLYYVKKGIGNFKEYISNIDSSLQVITLGLVLLFVLLISIFFVKPIVLTLIRWLFFKYIHKTEINAQDTKDGLTHDKVKDLSKTLFSELDEIDKESKEDFKKIEKIVDYQAKRKEE